MDIIFHRPQRAAHFIIAISIALSVGACVAPQPEPGASNAANQAVQAKPDPVQVVSDALGKRLHLMVSGSKLRRRRRFDHLIDCTSHSARVIHRSQDCPLLR